MLTLVVQYPAGGYGEPVLARTRQLVSGTADPLPATAGKRQWFKHWIQPEQCRSERPVIPRIGTFIHRPLGKRLDLAIEFLELLQGNSPVL
jgi:hypothetical protein